MDIDNTVVADGHAWVVCVAEDDEAVAQWQLQAYWVENRPRPAKAPPVEHVDSGWFGVLGFLAVIWAVPALDGQVSADLRIVGRLDAELVGAGEWWRAVTALTLHGDIAHIISNSFFGCIFGLFVGRYLGSGFGWLLVLASAVAANLTNAWLQPGAFRAIGASTATFAALGVAPAFAWRRGYFRGAGAVRGFAPLFGAIALFSFTGFGGQNPENIDVLGHLLGFAFGVLAGLGVANVNLREKSAADQQRAGGVALATVIGAWWLAWPG